jgi:hypothetical protein
MVALGTFLRAKRVQEVWRIAGVAGRGNVKGAEASGRRRR